MSLSLSALTQRAKPIVAAHQRRNRVHRFGEHRQRDERNDRAGVARRYDDGEHPIESDQQPRRAALRRTPRELAAERQAVGERAEHIPEHVLHLAPVAEQMAQRQAVAEGQRKYGQQIGGDDGEPHGPLERSHDGAVARQRLRGERYEGGTVFGVLRRHFDQLQAVHGDVGAGQAEVGPS